MLRDDILEKLFSNKEMQALPIGYQSVAVAVLNEVLEEIKEESPYVTISDLLSSTDATATNASSKSVYTTWQNG